MRYLTSIALMFVCLAVLTAGNCPQNTGSGDDDSADGTPSGTPTPNQSALSVDFDDLSFTHTYGVSPCPQAIGNITITNSTDTDASYTVSFATGTLVMADSMSGTIPAGGSVTVAVSFNCGDCVAAGFTDSVTVNVDNGAKTNEQSAPVSGSFMGCP